MVFLSLRRMVGFNCFVVFFLLLTPNAFPIVSIRVIVAGNMANCKSPLSRYMSCASSKGTRIIRL
jgi:hypothetical protein